MRQGEGEAQREGQNSGEGGDREGGSPVSQLTRVPLESPLLYGEAQASHEGRNVPSLFRDAASPFRTKPTECKQKPENYFRGAFRFLMAAT